MTTFQMIKHIWNSQSTSEKIGGFATVLLFPMLLAVVWVMTP